MQTFAMFKPGVLSRRIVGELITRLENKGFKIVGLKLMRITVAQAQTHYGEHKDKSFFNELVEYTTSGPVVAMVLEGDNVVPLLRKLTGATKVDDALPGTIRGDYALHTNLNIIHASDSQESAEREINHFFKKEELINWDDLNGKFI